MTDDRKTERQKIEAALQRAAHKAVHGTREERSGRFVWTPSEKAVANNSAERTQATRRAGKGA